MIDRKYRVVRTIGAGGMGVVVEAVHIALGHRVAVKFVDGVHESKRAMSRFLHEARVAAQLPGDHIGRAIDAGSTPSGGAYLVMELLIGRDLQVEIEERRRIPHPEAVDLLLQACEGTAEAHAIGLIHRDLKPANIFLARRRDGSRLVKVLDFGISKWAIGAVRAPSTLTNSAAGTPAYMAPEQFEWGAKVDARCDQHALAVVLYEMLTGAPPFVADAAHSLALLIARALPPPIRDRLPEVPAALEAAIFRALAKVPEERFPDLAAFARAIMPFGGEGAVTSTRNVTAILGASQVSITTARCTPRPPPPVSKDAAPTLLSRPIARSSPVDALAIQATAGVTPARRTIHPRALALGSVTLALAALGVTSLLLDAGDSRGESRGAAAVVSYADGAGGRPPTLPMAATTAPSPPSTQEPPPSKHDKPEPPSGGSDQRERRGLRPLTGPGPAGRTAREVFGARR